MGQPSEINSNGVEIENTMEPQTIKVKLHITLVFATKSEGSQKLLSKLFRRGDAPKEESENFNQAVREGIFTYEDRDYGEYLIKEKTFIIEEKSLQGMKNVSDDIDAYINKYSLDSNVSELVVCILIPILSNVSIIPKLFINSFPIKILSRDFKILSRDLEKNSINKINKLKSSITYYRLEKTIIQSDSKLDENCATGNKPFSQLQIQLAALMSYYIYFQIDMHEQQNWTILKKDITDRKRIGNFVTKGEKPPKHSFWRKLWDALTFIPGVTMDKLEKAFDFFCNYSGHVNNRIYGRIFDVLKIVYPNARDNFYIDKVISLLQVYEADKENFGIYDFFKHCGYWDYLGDRRLETYCSQWRFYKDKDNDPKVDTGWISGYGAALFTDGKDFFYVFKGTDFDSYGRDWLATNVLQGLTGFSLQHVVAGSKAKIYDKLVGEKGNLWFAGHSLGGGLASVATIATAARSGVTFNAAGLNVFGVKINQLLNHPSRIIFPWKDWNRVTPYRIKGEVLDTAQKYARIIGVPVLERGYGGKSVDIDIKFKDIPCASRHGINNFLYREVMKSLNTFNQSPATLASTKDNKIIKVDFQSRDIAMEGFLS